MNLPAGLIDNQVEFFNNPSNPEQCFCITGGQVTRVGNAPDWVKSVVIDHLNTEPNKVQMLISMGYIDEVSQLEKYCSCAFGAYDDEPDIANGQLIHEEYWPCPKKSWCPGHGLLCNQLELPNGVLTGREIEVLSLTGRGLLDKEIAGELGISIETIKIHLKNIRTKASLGNKQELVILAHRKNLL